MPKCLVTGIKMILPSEFFAKLEFFEHTMETASGTDAYDVFTLHFKSWWRRKKVIKIKRMVSNYNSATKTFRHRATAGAGDLYNQLNNWAISTFEEKLTGTKPKYTKSEEADNILYLKPRPKDINDD